MTFEFVLDWIVIIFLSTLMTTVDTLTLQAERQLRSQELRVLFKDPSDGFLVTPPVAGVSTHLMSPLAPWDIFTGFNPNSGNDLAVNPGAPGESKQEAEQNQQSC